MMKFNFTKKHMFIVAIVLVVALTVYLLYSRKKKKDEVSELIDAIDTDYKVVENSITDELKDVDSDPSYNPQADYDTLVGAKGVFWDDEEAVFETLSKLSKSQIKAVDDMFKAKQGVSLETFLKTNFLGQSDMDKATNIMKNSK